MSARQSVIYYVGVRDPHGEYVARVVTWSEERQAWIDWNGRIHSANEAWKGHTTPAAAIEAIRKASRS